MFLAFFADWHLGLFSVKNAKMTGNNIDTNGIHDKGTLIQKQLPSPTVVLKPISPCIFSINFLAIAKPRPVPEILEHRSEERRVGKECRSRWSPYH